MRQAINSKNNFIFCSYPLNITTENNNTNYWNTKLMDSTTEDKLVKRLQTGRVFLFLGFDYLSGNYSENPTLKILSNIFERDLSTFSDIFNSSEPIDIENDFHKIKNEIDGIPTNLILEPISHVNWNSIYTTSIDDLILSRLKTNNRSTQAICSNDKQISFNRNELNINYLFGLFNRTVLAEAVPTTRVQLAKRKNFATLMLSKLIESMTPIDTLCIYGWDAKTDPLDSEKLYGALSELQSEQCYLFDSDKNIDDEYINALITQKIIHPIRAHLPYFIEDNYSNLGSNVGIDSDFESFIKLNDITLELDHSIKRKIKSFGHILEDSDFYITKEEVARKGEQLSDFLYDSSRNPHWKAYPLNLDFLRDFVPLLKNKVLALASKNKVSTSPIILSGPTGTGKSIGLGRLCYELYKEERFVILHIQKATDNFDFRVLNDICEWVEGVTNSITVICWDGMLSIENYENLSNYLSNKGRKQIVIGTTYKSDLETSELYFEAGYSFSQQEKIRFNSYITPLVKDKKILVNPLESAKDDDDFESAFLVSLYRLLPDSRFNLTSGIVNEAIHTQDYLRKAIQTSEIFAESAIEIAFKNALSSTKDLPNLTASNVTLESINFNDIVSSIMIFGQFGVETPIEILMRYYPKLKVSNFGEILSKIDIIKWTENTRGDVFLAPRNTLEAEIYCKRVIKKKELHIEHLLGFISVVEEKSYYRSVEVDFCINIVKSFGPNGSKQSQYEDFYLEISQSIGALIKNKKIKNSRLMLQQSNLCREYGRRKFEKSVYNSEYLEILQDALIVIERGIEIEENKHRGVQRRNTALLPLFGEQTSILGTIANQIANKNINNVTDINFHIEKAMESAKSALQYNISNYVSLDSIAWIALDYAKRQKTLSTEQLSTLVRAIAVFDEHSVTEFEPRYKSSYLKRKLDLSNLANEKSVEASVLKELLIVSPSDFHYYKILKILNGVDIDEPLTDSEDLKKIIKVLSYFDETKDFPHDSFILNVMKLKLFWLSQHRKPLLQGEREVVLKGEGFWEEITALTLKVIKSSGNSNKFVYDFVLAVSLFNLGSYADADKIFKELERNSPYMAGARRVFKSFLLSDSSGPISFSGEVTSISGASNKGLVYIDKLGTSVPIMKNEFSIDESDVDSILNDLHVSFNFRGPIVEKKQFYKKDFK